MKLFGLKQPLYDAEGAGSGGVVPPVEDPPVKPKEPEAKGTGTEDLTGLKNKITELLGENKKLKTRVTTIDTAIEAEKIKTLAEEGKFDEALSEKDKKIEKQNETIKNKELKLIAKDFNDPADISLVQSLFEFDEDLNVTNADEVLAQLKEKKPYLFKGEGVAIIPGAGIIPVAGFKPGHKFTKEEVGKMTPDEYEKNAEAIDIQLAKGGF